MSAHPKEEDAIPQVQRHLPEGGLEGLIDRPWKPLLNVLVNSHPMDLTTNRFPLRRILMAPNTASFLESLGKPLGIAHDLESAPGVWWLKTPCDQHEYIVFSDSHRKNHWKGGQLCLASRDTSVLNLDHPAVLALQRGFEQVWGLPHPPEKDGAPEILADLVWFKDRTLNAGQLSWPQAPLRRPFKPSR